MTNLLISKTVPIIITLVAAALKILARPNTLQYIAIEEIAMPVKKVNSANIILYLFEKLPQLCTFVIAGPAVII